MKNTIQRKASKFIRKLKGNINFENVEKQLQKLGYKIIFFNTPKGDIEIARYKLTEKVKGKKAFTYTALAHIIFIDANVPQEDIPNLLYHEAGHILLGHFDGRILPKSDILMELEADAFAYELINYIKPRRSRPFSVVVLIMVIIFFVTYTVYKKYDTLVHADTVYVTATGSCYHRNSCIHIKERDCSVMERSQAEKIYDACKICNP